MVLHRIDVLRRIDGWRKIAAVLSEHPTKVGPEVTP
jgi:hypothetical protein